MIYTDISQLPLVLTIEDLISVLHIGRNKAYDLVKTKQIQSIKVGKQIRIPRAALERYLSTL
ncbi:helix-turn-helix domain-containing protein [Flavonifractor porci]|uniref:helix-turn-helix domain-containing protein n=1 Tax=Flavonifractor porci TaxID=3133422 RepID=UPI0030B1E1D5